jgi:hypothetical protein
MNASLCIEATYARSSGSTSSGVLVRPVDRERFRCGGADEHERVDEIWASHC